MLYFTELNVTHYQKSEECFQVHGWQSRIEIEYYSVAYFERITKFDALQR